ncbi:MAG: tetratricopeptide repeat-containing protein [Verrucomicrobiae bacterium]
MTIPARATVKKSDSTGRPEAGKVWLLEPQVTIESLHGDLLSLRAAISGGGTLRPPALREIWRTRLRPFWRLHPELYEGLAKRFAAQGENFLVIEVAAESRRFFGEQAGMLFLEALAAARSGSSGRCREILLSRPEILAQEADAPALLARTFKDAWKATGDPQFLERSFEYYHQAYLSAPSNAFPGVNAAAMALLAGKTEVSRALASGVSRGLDALEAGDYWTVVTRAECALILGDVDRAREGYRAACAGGDVPLANRVTSRAQARLLLAELGHSERDFDAVFALPAVAFFTGHRVDAPSRLHPRFPAAAVPDVRARLLSHLAAGRIEIGYSSAAQGGDILFAEALQENPASESHIFLPSDREGFRRQSVSMPGDPAWDARFDAVLAAADDVVGLDPARPGELDAGFFDYINRAGLGSAIRRARELDCEMQVIALWDGGPGPRGGTSDVVRLARAAGIPIKILPPILPGRTPEFSSAAADPLQRLFSIACGPLGLEQIPPSLFEGTSASGFTLGEAHFWAYFDEAGAALAFARAFQAMEEAALALHYGPATWAHNPLTGLASPGGRHAFRAREMLELCPNERICASAEFAAQAAVEGNGAAFEYLGRAAVAPGRPERQLFRLAAAASG